MRDGNTERGASSPAKPAVEGVRDAEKIGSLRPMMLPPTVTTVIPRFSEPLVAPAPPNCHRRLQVAPGVSWRRLERLLALLGLHRSLDELADPPLGTRFRAASRRGHPTPPPHSPRLWYVPLHIPEPLSMTRAAISSSSAMVVGRVLDLVFVWMDRSMTADRNDLFRVFSTNRVPFHGGRNDSSGEPVEELGEVGPWC